MLVENKGVSKKMLKRFDILLGIIFGFLCFTVTFFWGLGLFIFLILVWNFYYKNRNKFLLLGLIIGFLAQFLFIGGCILIFPPNFH